MALDLSKMIKQESEIEPKRKINEEDKPRSK